jgi:hypothetical protein
MTRGHQAWPHQIVKIAWFTVVRTPASLAHHARSCMYCRLSGTGMPSVNSFRRVLRSGSARTARVG